jgi:hypothetical protein
LSPKLVLKLAFQEYMLALYLHWRRSEYEKKEWEFLKQKRAPWSHTFWDHPILVFLEIMTCLGDIGPSTPVEVYNNDSLRQWYLDLV